MIMMMIIISSDLLIVLTLQWVFSAKCLNTRKSIGGHANFTNVKVNVILFGPKTQMDTLNKDINFYIKIPKRFREIGKNARGLLFDSPVNYIVGHKICSTLLKTITVLFLSFFSNSINMNEYSTEKLQNVFTACKTRTTQKGQTALQCVLSNRLFAAFAESRLVFLISCFFLVL